MWIGRFAWKRTFPADRLASPADCLTENPAGITERLAWHQIMPPSTNGRTPRSQAVSQETGQGSGRPRSVRSEKALRQVEQQSVLVSPERSVRQGARGSDWNGPHWIRFCAKTCASIQDTSSSEADIRGQEQACEDGAVVRRALRCPRPSLVHWRSAFLAQRARELV